jgi:uncharacterized protein (TIGR03435 family)
MARSALSLLLVAALVPSSGDRLQAAGSRFAGGIKQSASTRPEFEVASIKRNTTPMPTSSGRLQNVPPGETRLVAVPARSLVLRAYPTTLNPAEITGLPAWADSERYDVTVRASPDATRDETLQMWRALLADRMKLRAHYETRSRPAYRLAVARADGRLGPQIRRRAKDCPPLDPANRPSPPSPDFVKALQQPGPLPQSVQDELQSRCRSMFNYGPTMYAAGVQIGDLFRMSGLDRPLLDATGLEGFYDVTLTYSRPSGKPPGPDDPPVLFTAVQDQLGLKFENATIEDQMVVVEHIERPTEN